MQAGPVRAREWVLEFEPQGPSEIEPLMGWISSKDPLQQVRVVFQRLEEAISYCERRGLSFTIEKPARHKPRLRSYAENFLPSERTSITPTPVP